MSSYEEWYLNMIFDRESDDPDDKAYEISPEELEDATERHADYNDSKY